MNATTHARMIELACDAAARRGGTFQHDRGVTAYGYPTIGIYLSDGRRAATVCVDANGENPQVRTVQGPDGTPVDVEAAHA
jgi:hypothetical protein